MCRLKKSLATLFPESMQEGFTHICDYRKGVLSLCPPIADTDSSNNVFFIELDLNYFCPNLFYWSLFLLPKNFPSKTLVLERSFIVIS